MPNLESWEWRLKIFDLYMDMYLFSRRKELSSGIVALHCLVCLTEITCKMYTVHVHVHVPNVHVFIVRSN